MAIVLDTKYWPHNVRIPQGDAEGHQPIDFAWTPGAITDSRKLFMLPRGIQIPDCMMQLGDLDTGAALVLSLRISNGTTTKYLIHQTTVGQAGGVIRPTKIGTTEDGPAFITPDASYWVDLYVDTAANVAQAGNVHISFHFAGGAYANSAITD